MKEPLCLNPSETHIPEEMMPPDSTLVDDDGNTIPWRDYADHKILVRCCGMPAYGGGKTCVSKFMQA